MRRSSSVKCEECECFGDCACTTDDAESLPPLDLGTFDGTSVYNRRRDPRLSKDGRGEECSPKCPRYTRLNNKARKRKPYEQCHLAEDIRRTPPIIPSVPSTPDYSNILNNINIPKRPKTIKLNNNNNITLTIKVNSSVSIDENQIIISI